jgi:hypothetical protein
MQKSSISYQNEILENRWRAPLRIMTRREVGDGLCRRRQGRSDCSEKEQSLKHDVRDDQSILFQQEVHATVTYAVS